MSDYGKGLDFIHFPNYSQSKAGAVKGHVHDWRKISKDPWLISTIQGAEIPFMDTLVQLKEPRPYKFSTQECEFVAGELIRMLEQGILDRAPPVAGQVNDEAGLSKMPTIQFPFRGKTGNTSGLDGEMNCTSSQCYRMGCLVPLGFSPRFSTQCLLN